MYKVFDPMLNKVHEVFPFEVPEPSAPNISSLLSGDDYDPERVPEGNIPFSAVSYVAKADPCFLEFSVTSPGLPAPKEVALSTFEDA